MLIFFIHCALSHISYFFAKIVMTSLHEVRDSKPSLDELASLEGNLQVVDRLKVLDGHRYLPRLRVELRGSLLSSFLSILEVWLLLLFNQVLFPQFG